MQISSTKIGRPAPAARSASAAVPENQEKEWTVLFYNAGYNDEATMCTYSLDRLESVGSDENTHLVVMNHRTRWVGDKLLGRFADHEGTKTYYVTKDEAQPDGGWEKGLPADARAMVRVLKSGPHQLHSPVVDQHPDNPNMGDSATLKKFLLDNMKRFPAKHYAVVLSGHGAAFQGQMIMHHPEGRITNEELGQVFQDVTAVTGKKIDVVNFNTCYSANMESLFPLKNATEAVVASEDTVFAGTQPLAEGVADLQQALKAGVEVDGKDLARLFVERARRQDMGNLFVPTLSALDPGKFENVAESVKALQDTLMAEKVDPKVLAECMKESVRFEYSAIPRDIYVTDVGSFAGKVAEKVGSEKAKAAANALVKELKACVLAEQHAEHQNESLTTKGLRLLLGAEKDRSGAMGLSIYYDEDVNNDSRLKRVESTDYGKQNDPGKFLRYISQATEAERASKPVIRQKLDQKLSDYSKWKRRTGQKIPIPGAIPMAETVAMGAASWATFKGLSSLGMPVGDYLFGGYFVGKGAVDIAKGVTGVARLAQSDDLNSVKKEEMVELGAKAAIGACMGGFGLTMLGLAPQWMAWPTCLGALGLRVGKEVAKLAVRRPDYEAHRQEAREYAASSPRAKLSQTS